MTWERFKESPWKEVHPSYEEADLAMRPAPEYASSEVLLAALYRRIGLSQVGEAAVTGSGKDLMHRVDKGGKPAGATASNDQWARVLRGILESPKGPNQSAKRFLQLTPLVPEAARYSGSARLAGNPWAPGQLVERMVWLGTTSESEASRVWEALFAALSVDGQDDLWARWLEAEFGAWRQDAAKPWALAPLSTTGPATFGAVEGVSLKFPARQFVRDLDAMISVKHALTRRQWTSLLEAVLRIASVAHVLWLCDVGRRSWDLVVAVLGGQGPADAEGVRRSIFPADLAYFPYGSHAMELSSNLVTRYLRSRLGINATLWALEELGERSVLPLSTAGAFASLLEVVQRRRQDLARIGLMEALGALHDSEARTLSCSRGIGSNIIEFVRHASGQRAAAREVLRGYDQGYSMRKRSPEPRSRWIVSLGPVAVMAMVHTCLHGSVGPRSIQRLCEHLAGYGISISPDAVGASDLGHKLRLLGLVLDSPDAEKGMLVLPPFGPTAKIP